MVRISCEVLLSFTPLLGIMDQTENMTEDGRQYIIIITHTKWMESN